MDRQNVKMIQKPKKLFIAYAHKDKDLKDELQTRLATNNKEIEIWHAAELKPGDEWQKAIS